MSALSEPWHGTYAGYTVHGCRCDHCRAAKREQSRSYRARRRAGEIPPPATACGWCGELLEHSGPGRPRKFCSTRCQKRAEDVGTCSCGARKSKRARNCASCSAREAKQRLFAPLYARIERMWADGLTLRQMAQELGWKFASVGPFIWEARTSGRLNLPYRRSPEAVAAIRAGQARRRAEREALQADVPSEG